MRQKPPPASKGVVMSANQSDRWRTEVDQQLGVLTTEVSGIKAQLRDQGETLGKIFSRLDEIRGKQGPGIGQVLTITLSGAGIVSLAAGAITVLVTSFVSPQITRLETQSHHHDAVVTQLLDERIYEFKRLKAAERAGVEERFRKLEEQVSQINAAAAWAPRVNPN